MKTISTEQAPAAIGPYSQAKVVNGMAYLSGQIPLDPLTGEVVGKEINAQTKQVLKNVGAVLEAANSSLEEVVKTTCFLTDMANFAEFNEIYGNYFVSNPARSCVAAKQLPKGVLVEAEVIACVK